MIEKRRVYNSAVVKLILRLVLLGACLPLMSCAAGSRTIGETAADTLPTWLVGEPKGLPPRSSTPEYDAWMAKRAQQDQQRAVHQ